MTVQPSELMKMLVSLGLTEYEARVYSTLLTNGTCTVSEIAFRSGVPRPKVYPTVKALVKRNLAVLLPEEPIKCKPLPPDISLTGTVSRYEEAAKRARKALSELSKIYASAKVAEDHERQELWVLKTREAVQLKLSTMLRDARESIILLLDDHGVKAVHEMRDLVRSVSEQNVEVRLATRVSRANLSQLADIAEHVEIRHVTATGAENLCIRDEAGILFFNVSEDGQAHGSTCLVGVFAENSRLASTWSDIVDKSGYSQGIPFVVLEELFRSGVVYEDLLDKLDKRLFARLGLQAVAAAISHDLVGEAASGMMTAIGRDFLGRLLDAGLKVVLRPSLTDSLHTLASLSPLFSENPASLKYDDVLKMLTAEIPSGLPPDVDHTQKSDAHPPPSMLNFLVLGLIDHFGYSCRVLKETYDQKRDVWVVQHKLLKKAETPTQIGSKAELGHLET